jgi:hypothetical protein
MDIEKRIKEQRFAIAVTNDFMGPQGIFVFIAKNLGDEIIQDSMGDVYQNYLPEFNEPPPSNKLIFPEFDEESTSFVIGYSYNKNGIEIVYKEYDQSIKVFIQGELMYHEQSDDLLLFRHNEQWEKLLKDLNMRAREKYSKKMEVINAKKKEEVKDFKVKFLEDLKKKWGDDLF